MKKYSKWMIVFLIALAIFSIWYFDVLTYFSVENVNQYLESWSTQVNEQPLLFSLVGILVYMVVATFALPVSTVVTMSMGILFGFTHGVIVVVLGATFGASINFLLTRYLLGESLQRKYGEKLVKINQELDKNGTNYLLTLRLIPIFPFFLINIATGLSNVKFSTFFLTTLFGIVPGTAAYVYLGASLTSLTDGTPGIPTNVILAFVVLGVFALLPVVYKKIKRQA